MKRSLHSLSHYKLFTADMGELIPCGIAEVLPGDTIQMATSALLRVAPMLSPVMHPVHVRLHHWYVPFRMIWNEWEDFITGGPSGTSTPAFPTITLATVPVGSLADYLGVPTGATPITVSALPFRAYTLIWNENYRDQDLESELSWSATSGADASTNTVLQNVDWEKDYFTTARPWEQKGPAITVPIGTSAPVRGLAVAAAPGWGGAVAGHETGGINTNYDAAQASVANNVFVKRAGATAYPDVTVDLTGASAVTVNILRQALAMQRFEEARARYGSRYVEYLRYLGVRSSDARLQRPEYLGGGKQTVQFSEVLATAETGSTVKVGDMKGHGLAAMRSNKFRRFIEEHGYILTFMSVRPKTMYVQGLQRHWNRRAKEDFWQKELQHIGQQKVLNKEVYAYHASPDGTFGYQDRYDEYRRTESTIAGEFRTSALDFWHMGRIFSSDPALNATFVKANPTKRILASTSTDGLYIMANHRIMARRLVAKEGTSFIS